MVETAESIQEAISNWREKALVVATSAQWKNRAFRGRLSRTFAPWPGKKTYFSFLAPVWGLSEEVLNLCDFVLEPIRGAGPEDYRHLSVRSAVSICLDRLAGSWYVSRFRLFPGP